MVTLLNIIKGADVQLLLQPEDLEHDDQSNLKLKLLIENLEEPTLFIHLKQIVIY